MMMSTIRGFGGLAKSGPDAKIVSLTSEALSLVEAHRQKEAVADGIEFETAEQENAFYADLDHAYVLSGLVLKLRAKTANAVRAKARMANTFFRLGHDEEAHKVALSVCADLEAED